MPVKGGQAALPFMYRSTPMAFKPDFRLLFLLFNLLFPSCSGFSDAEILLEFRDSLSNASELDNWTSNDFPCNGNVALWKGVICVDDHVWGLRLERMGLNGKLDLELLEGMSDLKSLSFMHNNFEGPFPVVKKLPTLRSLFLADNQLSGEIPDHAFLGMSKLTKVFLGKNEFIGPIPSSLASLRKLVGVGLEDNKFTGKIPDFTSPNLISLNVSNNQLEGPIPPSLTKFGLTSFTGNKGLCGPPMSPCEPSKPTPTLTPIPTPTTPNNTSTPNENGSSDTKAIGDSTPSLASIIVVIIVAIVALAAIILAAFILTSHRGQQASLPLENPPPTNLQIKTVSRDLENVQRASADQPPIARSKSKAAEPPKLSFVRDDRERFDLPDLLKASAEILGSGCFGSSYKAALSTGPKMVVKRFKQMNNVGKEEFNEHMRRLGRLRHPNVLPLIAYYYRKEEKLLVSDFVHYGSLSNILHGRQSENQKKLTWATRLNIVKGVGKGLAYLYKELPSLIVAHGHLKSSNVLLDENFVPVLADYGFVPVINQENAHELMAAYKSPEYRQLGRITRKTDVWSLGILIIELLTSKFPSIFLPKGKGRGTEDDDVEEDLANWVNSVPEDQWLDKVIDKEIRATKHCESEMIKLLKIGLSCAEKDVEKRLDLKQVVEIIDEIKEKNSDDDDSDDDNFKSSHATEYGDKMSSGKSDDFLMIS